MFCVFESLARRVARRPRMTIGIWALVTVVGFLVAVVGVTGQGLFDRLATGEPSVAGSQSQEGNDILAAQSTAGPSVTLLVSNVTLANPELGPIMAKISAEVAAIEHVTSVIDPFLLPNGIHNPAAGSLLAESGNGFLLVAEVSPLVTEDESLKALDDVVAVLDGAQARLAATEPAATTLIGGNTLIVNAITDQVQRDLTTGEAVALPIALLIMVLVFGGFLAASMPMAAALASIGAGLGTLYILSYPLEIDGSVVNVVTLLSIGLSIDYGLLIVSRFREELARAEAAETAALSGAHDSAGAQPARRRRRSGGRNLDPVVMDALSITMRTAGRTVAFSALTVAISIAGLMVFTPAILRAIGAAGLAIVLLAVLTGLTLVPALLVLSGRRLGRLGVLHRVKFLRRILTHTADVESDEGIFSRLAERVQRRPWWVLGGALIVLVVLALPLSGMHMRNSGIALLPASADQRQFVTQLASEYPASANPDLVVVTSGPLDKAAELGRQIEAVPHVTGVGEPTPMGAYIVVGVEVVGDDPGGENATSAVREIRELNPETEFWVTGQAAGQIDFTDALADRVWWAVSIVVLATFALLFLMTGSVVVPLKALITNAMSLAASLGVLTWVFQSGHLEWLLRFESTGGLETYVVALVIAFAFGLAMDYEVFLLARIKELHDSGLDNNTSVRLGLQRSGRIITSAAAIIAVVFAGFIFGQLLVIKEVGFALAFAVALDATLVRMLLVPATMTVLGERNWWAPPPMRRIYERFSITH